MPRPAELVARAPAKVNLTLHVLGRREDGYHELESLVAFAGIGDTLALRPGEALTLAASGPTAAAAGEGEGNLVLRAAHALAERRPGLRSGAFRLTKRLPVAAGLGGGSSDAAAALRLLARLNGLRADDPALLEAARSVGADVPVCLAPRARMMRGAGERLGPALRLPPLPAILINPGAPVPTAAVFAALGLERGAAMPGSPHPDIETGTTAALLDSLAGGRNDLETPASGIAPIIAEALQVARSLKGCRLARMSGSGATIFALFQDRARRDAAALLLRRARPGWWVAPTILR